MGWTCQHDYKGYCKRIEMPCVPGMKGCILKSSDYTFSDDAPKEYKKDESTPEEIDFAVLVRGN